MDLIEVASAGVNRPDILQRQGKYPPPPGASDVLGLEVAGTVVATGNGCTRFAVGDQVCALVASGGYAEYCVAPEPQCLPVPGGVELIEGQELLRLTPETSIRDAANKMIARNYQQAPVVSATDPDKMLGWLTLNDIARQQNAAEG